MNYDSTYAGAVLRKEQGEVYTLRPDGKCAYAGAVQDFTTQVILTGYTMVSQKRQYRVQNNRWWMDFPFRWWMAAHRYAAYESVQPGTSAKVGANHHQQ